MPGRFLYTCFLHIIKPPCVHYAVYLKKAKAIFLLLIKSKKIALAIYPCKISRLKYYYELAALIHFALHTYAAAHRFYLCLGYIQPYALALIA